MTEENDTIRVFIPLTQRRRNGRPRLVPPDPAAHLQSRSQDPHILRALGRAWAWRRRLESGQAATVNDIAKVDGVSDRFVGRMVRLTYLSPAVLERLLIHRQPPSVSIKELGEATCLPWTEQLDRVFDECGDPLRTRVDVPERSVRAQKRKIRLLK